jgi:flagellar hook-basal body complex protein FliE
MIEGVSAMSSASPSASVRSPQSAASPTEGPSFDQALTQAIGSAIDTLQTGEAVAI